MNFNKHIKIVFVFLIGTIFTTPIFSQAINLEMVVYKLRSTYGMPDYENYDRTPGWTKPDLNFNISSSSIWIGSKNFPGINYQPWESNPNYTRRFFYENRWPSSSIYPLNGPLGDEDYEDRTDVINTWVSPNGTVNLGKPWSIYVLTGFDANEDDRPFQQGFGGDDDYRFIVRNKWVPMSRMAPKGDSKAYVQLSNAGYTHSHGGSKYPYYVTMRSSYIIDPIQTYLTILNPDHTPGYTFCAGKPLKVKVNYKNGYTGGYFRWEIDVNGNNNWVLLRNWAPAVIDDFARNSNTRYRARAMSSSNTYGVPDFYNGTKCIAYSATGGLLVQQTFDSFTFEKVDACPGSQGAARLTNIIGANEGLDYIINFFDGVAIVQRDTILNYSSTTLLNQNITFSNFPGNYDIQVLNLIPELRCGIKKPFTIHDSVIPEFEASKTDPFCFGENGAIVFSNIKFKNNVGPFEHIISAESSTAEIFMKSINSLNDSISVPPGTYTLRIENMDGCSYQFPSSITLNPKPELLASIIAPPTYQSNGVSYNGYCQEETFGVAVNILGGVKPYKINLQKNGGAIRMYQLLESESTFVLPDVGHGDYSMTVVDVNGCTTSPILFDINNPSLLQFENFNFSNPTLACGDVNIDGTITTGVSGGIPPYSYFFDGQTVPAINYTTLENGTYSIEIVDANNCSISKSVTLTDPAFFRMSDQGSIPYQVVPCAGSVSFRIFVEGGYIDNYDDRFTFKLNGIDCASNPDCNEVPGTYVWGWEYYDETSSTTYEIRVDNTNLQTIEVTDDSGCTLTSNYQFESPFIPEVGSVTNVPPACVGDDYELTFYLKDVNESVYGASEPIDYVLDGLAGAVHFNTEDSTVGGTPLIPYQFTIPVANPGNHDIIITDYLSCTSGNAFHFDLLPIDTFKLDILEVKDVNCSNDSSGSVTVQLSGNPPFILSYSNFPFGYFDPDNPGLVLRDTLIITDLIATITNLSANYYYISATNANGCSVIDSLISIENPSTITAMVTSNSAINCTGSNGIIEVTNIIGGTPPYQVALNEQAFQSNTSLSGAQMQNSITIKDANACFLSLNLSIPTAAQTLFSSFTPYQGASDCAKGSAILEIPAGFMEPLIIQEIEHPDSSNAIQVQDYGTVVATENYLDTLYDLTLGTHYYLIQDGLGCELIDSVEIAMADTLLAVVTLNKFETCYQQSADGALEVTVSGGQAPYVITLDGENYDTTSNISSFTDLSYGNYFIQVEDAGGCLFYIQDSIIAGSIPWVEGNINNFIGCTNDSLMADLNLVGSNGSAPFTFTWEDGATTDQKTVLAPSEYHITVTDADGCWTADNIVVLGPDTLQIAINSITDAICHADNNGAVTVTANGGFPPYSFSIDGGTTFQPDSTFSALTIGDYEILIKDDHDCIDTTFAKVSFSNPLEAEIVTTAVNCNGENNGRIQANLIGGIAPFSYSLDDINFLASNIFTDLATGMYNVYIQDGSGCKAAYFGIVIDEPTALNVSTILINEEACGQMNGAASGTAFGGTPPLVYEWDGNPILNTLTLNNASAGLHTLVVTDANGCVESSSISIANLSAPTASVLSSTDEICGNANGMLSVQILNGTGPMTFAWSHDLFLNAPIANNLSAGTYTLSITDVNNCKDTLTRTIDEIAGPTLSLSSKSNSTCSDDNGEIALQTANGTGLMTFHWSHDASLNAANATGLSAGSYEITVIDANACQDNISISIDFDSPPMIGTTSLNKETCGFSNGSIAIPVSGGTAPYQYTWSHDASLNSSTANNLAGGLYSVTVTDFLGCSTALLNINLAADPPPVLTVQSFVNADCINPLGRIRVEVSGGLAPFTYSWSHDPTAVDPVISDLMSGTYTATVTDANGCTSEVSQSLISFVGSAAISKELDCFGDSDGEIQLTLEGDFSDYSYAWSDAGIPAGPSASNLSAGTYTVTVTNVNGCTETFSEEIINPEQILPNISDVIPVGCLGNLGSATAFPTGGSGTFAYLWSDTNAQTTATADNLTTGIYDLTVSDVLGCSNTVSIIIDQSIPITVAEDVVSMPLCAGASNGSISINTAGGFGNLQYQWNTNQNTASISGLSAGTYILTVLDEVACTAELSVELNEPAILSSTIEEVEANLCHGDNTASATAVAAGGTGPFQYTWNDSFNQSTATAVQLAAGDYIVEIMDANACTDQNSITIGEPLELSVEEVNITSPICYGEANGTIEIFIEGGTSEYQYNWNAGTLANASLLENLNAGNYDLVLTDGNGCELLESFEVIDPEEVLITSANVIPGICKDAPSGSIDVIAEGGDGNLTYNWSNGAEMANISNLSSGLYTITVTDGLGCEAMATYEVTSSQIDFINLGQADTLVCNGAVMHYDFSDLPFETFSWSNESGTNLSDASNFSITSEGVYYLSAITTEGCIVTDTIEVSYAAQNLDAFFIAPTDIVVGDTLVAVELTLPIPDEVDWSYNNEVIEYIGQNENQYFFTFSEVGTFDLHLSARLGGCNSEVSKQIFVYADSTEIPFINPLVPKILNVRLFPNPNKGKFTVEVDLSEEEDMVIDIFDTQGQLYDRNLFTGAKNYVKGYNLTLPTGIYYAIFQVAGERRTLTLVVD